MTYYDQRGWATDVPDPERDAGVKPPTCPKGQEPNWTGVEWVCAVRPAPVAPTEELPLAPEPRYIKVDKFFDRFGAYKWPILSSADLQVKALVTDCMSRLLSGINLDTKDVAMGVAMLRQKNFPVDPALVIDAPLRDDERQ